MDSAVSCFRRGRFFFFNSRKNHFKRKFVVLLDELIAGAAPSCAGWFPLTLEAMYGFMPFPLAET